MSRLTEVEARRLARAFARALAEEPEVAKRMVEAHEHNRAQDFAGMFLSFVEGTDYGKASAAEERQDQREAIRDAVWSWMAKVYARCPRIEMGETMELTIIADQSGYCSADKKGEEFEAFTFRLETKTTEGEF